MLRYLYYIRYFFFIAWNWNLQLAIFTIYHEIRGERKYGLDTARLHQLHHLTISGRNIAHAQIYQGASYFLLEHLFSKLSALHTGQHFVDMGCGKGRALAVAATYGFNRVTGVDFALELCREASISCQQAAIKNPALHYKIVHADAAEYRFEDNADVIYFFNPFDELVMLKVMKNLVDSQQRSPRDVYIIYLNPQLKSIMIQAGFHEIYHIKKIEFVEGSILKKSP